MNSERNSVIATLVGARITADDELTTAEENAENNAEEAAA